MPALELSDLELAAGTAIGGESTVPLPGTALDAREALEQACVAALVREPCIVSFSGGRDSSAVLATAVRVARERGLAAPIPVSLRFPDVPSTEESSWQELVIRHMRLTDWVRIEIGDELDFLGPWARAGLSKHGLLWPANAHFHSPIFERAGGGSVLTGLDGDGLLGGWRWRRAQAVLERRARPAPRDVMRVALALAPESVRAARLARRQQLHVSWLRPDARRLLAGLLARERASEPRPWPARVAWFAGRRYLKLGVHSLALLAEAHDVEVHHPLLDPTFLSALAARGGPAGYGTRQEATRALFGDLLPAELVVRPTKGEFGMALWGPQARRFAAHRDGAGVDPELVDADLLRAVWSKPNPPLGAATLLQHAWLEATRSSAGELQPTPSAWSGPSGG